MTRKAIDETFIDPEIEVPAGGYVRPPFDDPDESLRDFGLVAMIALLLAYPFAAAFAAIKMGFRR